jgi:NADPH:quinone reductase-like Zn-dependent oxidoreductase
VASPNLLVKTPLCKNYTLFEAEGGVYKFLSFAPAFSPSAAPTDQPGAQSRIMNKSIILTYRSNTVLLVLLELLLFRHQDLILEGSQKENSFTRYYWIYQLMIIPRKEQMTTMKAVRIHEYGSREVLSYEEAPCPDLAKEDVLIQVAATSVNPFDWAVREGYLAGYYSYDFPLILGLDVSGVVKEVGSDVQGISIGDAVYARSHPSRNGAYAPYISLPASEVAAKPRSLDQIQSAAVPHVAYSAWHALINVADLSAGQTVLIHGATGGVGSFAVQLAKLQGAQVVGTCSAKNLDFLISLGADEAIDYNATRFEEVVHDVDLVLDLVGDAGDNTQQRSWQVLKPGGMLASLVQFPSQEAAAEHHVQGVLVSADACNRQSLTEIGALIDGGQLFPTVSTILPLTDIRQAHAQSESRHVRGKIVLRVNGMA